LKYSRLNLKHLKKPNKQASAPTKKG